MVGRRLMHLKQRLLRIFVQQRNSCSSTHSNKALDSMSVKTNGKYGCLIGPNLEPVFSTHV